MERKTKIKVAQIIGIAANGGIESLWLNYYKNIDRSQIEFDFLVENESDLINNKDIKKLGGRIIIIPSYKNIFKYISFLKRLFIKEKYDIVHSNMSTLSVFSLFAAKKAKINIRIAHSHSTSNIHEFKKSALKTVLKHFSKMYATHYFSCSNLAGQYLYGKKVLNSKKYYLINNAVDINKFMFSKSNRENIRSKYNIPSDNFVIGNVGRLCAQKNQSYLIDVFSKINDENKFTTLLIVGSGKLYDDLKKKVEKLGLSDSVVFAGSQKNIEKFYSAMDLFFLPSLYEGLPVVGIEAQANGLSCVFSNKITKEVNIENNNIFIDISKSPKDSFKKIINMNCNKIESRNNINNILDNFDIIKESKKLLNIYINILKNE